MGLVEGLGLFSRSLTGGLEGHRLQALALRRVTAGGLPLWRPTLQRFDVAGGALKGQHERDSQVGRQLARESHCHGCQSGCVVALIRGGQVRNTALGIVVVVHRITSTPLQAVGDPFDSDSRHHKSWAIFCPGAQASTRAQPGLNIFTRTGGPAQPRVRKWASSAGSIWRSLADTALLVASKVQPTSSIGPAFT